MYHFDGHRSCGVKLAPEESKKLKKMCPVCKKELTIGVLHRVDNLRDRELGTRPSGAIPFKKIIPLPLIIADYLQVGKQSLKVMRLFQQALSSGHNEFSVLLDVPQADLQKLLPDELAAGIVRVREQRVTIDPGYDGVYGTVSIFSDADRKKTPQSALF